MLQEYPCDDVKKSQNTAMVCLAPRETSGVWSCSAEPVSQPASQSLWLAWEHTHTVYHIRVYLVYEEILRLLHQSYLGCLGGGGITISGF